MAHPRCYNDISAVQVFSIHERVNCFLFISLTMFIERTLSSVPLPIDIPVPPRNAGICIAPK